MSTSTQSAERVAVIAVHGVGDQRENDTATEIARLLQRANPGIYTAFREETIELAVAASTAPEGGPQRAGKQPPWFIRSPFVRHRWFEREALDREPELPSDIAFTRSLVDRVQPEDRTEAYSTIRVCGARHAAGATCGVDIYELYWADLSRLSGNVMQVLGKLYQLLFHLASLGRKTVEHAWLSHSDETTRRALVPIAAAHTTIEALVGAVLPVLNLWFAAFVLPVLWVLCPERWWQPVLAALCGIAAGALALWATYHWLYPRKAWRALIAPVLAIAIGAAIFSLGMAPPLAFATLYLATLAAAIGLAAWLSYRLAKRREDDDKTLRRSIALWTAAMASAVGVVLTVIGMRRNLPALDLSYELVQGSVLVSEGFWILLFVAWSALTIIAFAVSIYVFFANMRFGRDNAIRRAIWTAQIGYFIPASLFLVTAVILWKIVVHLISTNLHFRYAFYEYWLRLPDWLAPKATENGHNAIAHIEGLSTVASGALFDGFFLLLVVAVVLLLFGLLPSVIRESFPRSSASDASSRRLGQWLDDGFFAAKLAGVLVLLGLIVLLPLGELAKVIDPLKEKLPTFLLADNLASKIGAAIAGSVALLTLFRKNMFGGAQKALDIALDVDNWLKERPIKRSPRGLILARYMALLREVEQHGYDRVVFVTHSQGTVITADLLRYLNAEQGVRWQRQHIERLRGATHWLLTVGSPLRQLYSLRFPDLYGWARHQDEAEVGARSPDPTALGVQSWVNGYRSGDYVGRYLWRSDHDTDADRYGPADVRALADAIRKGSLGAGGRVEFCLGAGAHTHYFDDTATPVGQVIDALIVCPVQKA